MNKVANPDFFKRSGQSSNGSNQPERLVPVENKQQLRQRLTLTIRQSADCLTKIGFGPLAKNVVSIYQTATKNRFSVAVVGEFNRGKSTMINRLLGGDFLPTADLPTTAILTKIRHGVKPAMSVYGNGGVKIEELEFSKGSWKGLTADNFGGKEPGGFIIAELNDLWLAKYGIEIIDTPGAGDLDKERSRIIGDALVTCDGAIIAVSATAALSMSEKIFIEQRLITKKTPFLGLVITKLDMVALEERNQVIKYVEDKLRMWEMNIPVLVADEVELPSEENVDKVGIDKVRELIVSWVQNTERAKLTETWLISQVIEVLDMAKSSLLGQEQLLRANDKERLALIREKKQELDRISMKWESLRLELLKRCTSCQEQFFNKVADYEKTIVERLQYEAMHTVNPQKWWSEDYPYRLKVEIANVAIGLDSFASSIIINDAKWFNTVLNQQFKSYIQIDKNTVADKKEMTSHTTTRNLEFEDLNKKKNMFTVGTVALSIAGVLALSATGLGIVATLGIGAVANILTGKFFNKKLEDQRKEMSDNIAKDVPRIILNATNESETRLKIIYNDIIAEAVRKETVWKAAQAKAIEEANKPQDAESLKQLQQYISQINNLMGQFEILNFK